MAGYEIEEHRRQLRGDPHNQNIGKGLMFPVADRYDKAITEAHVESRMRWEPIA
jgi:hypothetical protein